MMLFVEHHKKYVPGQEHFLTDGPHNGDCLSLWQLDDLRDVARGTRWLYPPTEGYILACVRELKFYRTELTLWRAIKLWWTAFVYRRGWTLPC